MINGMRLQVALLALASGLMAGCGASSPSTPSVLPPTGTIELAATSRPDGATLGVNVCVEPENEPWPCTRDLQMTYSVVLNRDLDRARIFTQFYTTTGQLCAATNTELGLLTAGTPVTLTASSVFLSLQGSSTSPECALPLRTTRMVAHLNQDGGPAAGDLLTQEFARAYTFVNP